jgi:choline-sulfatase
VLLKQIQETPEPEYDGPIDCDITVKATPVADEYELYDLTNDPMELNNRYNDPAYAEQQVEMEQILAEQRAKKRLSPISGVVPGQ